MGLSQEEVKTMKRIFIILAFVLLPASLLAQAPEKINYQAIIRNSSNQLVTDQNIKMRISLPRGSATGTAVQVQTLTTTTDGNGLAAIVIGFGNIDWWNWPYYIKIQIDPTGGMDYTIEETSQILSVPYALHSKTAETVSGTFSETDPFFLAWDKDYADLTNKPVNATTTSDGFMSAADKLKLNGLHNADGSETKITAGTNITVSGNGTGSDPYLINAKTYKIGDFAQGGIVFYVDQKGQHGLVCAKSDQDGGSGMRWYAGIYGNTRARGDGPYAGEANTSIIIASSVAIGIDGSTFAARICNELRIIEGGKTYSDWYLPSKYELNLMHQHKATINALATDNGGSAFVSFIYWSSTESHYQIGYAWSQNFSDGNQMHSNKDLTYRVRAVRAF